MVDCGAGFCIWTLSAGVWQAENHCINTCVCSNVTGGTMTTPVFIPWALVRGVSVQPTDTQARVPCEPLDPTQGGGGGPG
jgi:hypothetical protein